MRSSALAAALCALTVAVAAGCSARARPYQFSSPMLGTASVPGDVLQAAPVGHATSARRDDRAAYASQPRRAEPIRVVPAPPIREASAAAATAVTSTPAARPEARTALPHPHVAPIETPLPVVREVTALRALVGRRDLRDPVTATLAWARSLGATAEGATGSELVAWAAAAGRLREPAALSEPGDLLVFDAVVSDEPADLLALVVGRDDRGVVELVYLGHGVIRRGYVDPTRPRLARDPDGRSVNTFMRHGRRWPARGSRYLAGELVSASIRVH